MNLVKIVSSIICITMTMFLSFNLFASSDLTKTSGLKIEGWVAESPSSSTIFAAYLTIANNQDKTIQIISADSPHFEMVELHLSEKQNGVMTMRKIKNMVIEPNTIFEMKPGSYHMMLIKNKKPIQLGDWIALNIQFNDGLESINLAVKKRSEMMSHRHNEAKH